MPTEREIIFWNNLSDNQMVSYTDAPGGGFILNPGKGHVTSDQCNDRLNALERYRLEGNYMAKYANNQLVPKIDWIPTGSCELQATGFVKIPTSLPVITLVTTTNPNNQAGNNATATITFVGGVGPFTYTLNSVPQGAATPTFTINGLLAATTYTVKIIDSNNNSDSTTFTIGNIVPLANVLGGYGNTTRSAYFPLGGYYSLNLCPIFSAASIEFPGYEDINTRSIVGNYFDMYPIRLFTPTVQTTNLTVEVFARALRIWSESNYANMSAVLVYAIAPTGARESVVRNSPKIQFPNSPIISYPVSGSNAMETPWIRDSTYSVTIPNINVGQTLYVFWEINGANYFYSNAYFQYEGFKITLKKFDS